MKKTLLYFILPMLFTATLATAQDRDWQIGTTSESWPADLSMADDATIEVDGLTVAAVSNSFGAMRSAPSDFVFGDGYAPENEWPGNGSSGIDGVMPSRRYFSFPVTGPSTIKVYFRVNGSGGRSVQISDGNELLAEGTSEESSDPITLTASYDGEGGTIYVYATASVNYHRITVMDGLLSVDDKSSSMSSNIKAIGNRIVLSNVKSNTEVNIFSVTGALIKTINTNKDLDFEFKSGLWFATVKSAEGQKSAKLLVK